MSQHQPRHIITHRHVPKHIDQILQPVSTYQQTTKDQWRERRLPDLQTLSLLLPLEPLGQRLLRRWPLPLGRQPDLAPLQYDLNPLARAPFHLAEETPTQQARDPSQRGGQGQSALELWCDLEDELWVGGDPCVERAPARGGRGRYDGAEEDAGWMALM